MTYICPIARSLGSNWRHKQRTRLHEKQKGKCFWCKKDCTLFLGKNKKKQLTIDHIIPVCVGGSHEDGNLVGACFDCNSERGKVTKNNMFIFSKTRNSVGLVKQTC